MSADILRQKLDGLTVIRERVFIRHETPTVRDITNEVTLLNLSKSDLRLIQLVRIEFMPGLRVLDDDGSELSFYPNELVRLFLEEVSDEDEMANLLDKMNKREIFVLWIRLPYDKPIRFNELRTIRLKFSDNRDPRHRGTLFNIPRFTVLKKKPPDERYETHFFIEGPRGFELGIYEDPTETNIATSDGLHRTITSRCAAVRIPYLDKTVSYKLLYDILPEKTEKRLLTFITISLLVTSAIILTISNRWVRDSLTHLTHLTLVSVLVHLSNVVHGNLAMLAGYLITVSLAIMGLTTNPLTHRTKYYFLGTVVLSLLALFLS